jgi:uncharacterized tellurite resistance protein B-like protein
MEPTILSLASLDLNELEAFVELMFLAAHTDGAVNADERAAFRGQVIKGTHGQLEPHLVDQLLSQIEARVLSGETQRRLSSIGARLRDPRKRHAALVHAARVVLADGVLGLDEVAFLERAVAAVGDPSEDVRALLREAREPG